MVEFLAGWTLSSGAQLPHVKLRVCELLETEGLACFSIVMRGAPLTWTAFVAIDPPDRIVMLTSKASQHGSVLIPGQSVAVNLYVHTRVWGEPICGLQGLGTMDTIGDPRSEAAYRRRFPEYCSWREAGGRTESEFFAVRLNRLKLIDERLLGEETYVCLSRQ